MAQKRTTSTGKIRWVGRYRDPAGKEHSKSFTTRRDATAWEAERQREVRRREWIDPTVQDATVGELVQAWAQRPLRDGTTRSYLLTHKNLGPLAGMPAVMLTRADVDGWHRQLTAGRSWMGAGDRGIELSTARQHVIRLSAVLNGAVDDGVLARNVVKIPPKQSGKQVLRSDVPTTETVRSIVTTLSEGGARYSSRARVPKAPRGTWHTVTREQESQPIIADMVLVAVGTGMRLSELCALRIEDVEWLRREVRVEVQLSVDGKRRVVPKTAASVRVIPVADDLMEVLDRRAGTSEGGWLFETSRGTPYRAATAGQELRKTVGHLAVKVTFHSFRHLYASRLVSSGVSVKAVQRVMGHSSAATTLDVYAHFMPSDDELSRAAIAGAVAACGIGAGSADGGGSLVVV